MISNAMVSTMAPMGGRLWSEQPSLLATSSSRTTYEYRGRTFQYSAVFKFSHIPEAHFFHPFRLPMPTLLVSAGTLAFEIPLGINHKGARRHPTIVVLVPCPAVGTKTHTCLLQTQPWKSGRNPSTFAASMVNFEKPPLQPSQRFYKTTRTFTQTPVFFFFSAHPQRNFATPFPCFLLP